MSEECLICKEPLEYLHEDVEMECEICHKKENSKTRCVNGHYVCSDCHMQGIDSLIGLCLKETSRNPVAIMNKMMAMPFCHMHGPEHHVMVGMALLTAFKNAGGCIDLEKSLQKCIIGTFCTRRGLRILGRLRSRDQYGDISLHCHRGNTSWRRELWTVSQNDLCCAGRDR